jgi:hypothetical protein
LNEIAKEGVTTSKKLLLKPWQAVDDENGSNLEWSLLPCSEMDGERLSGLASVDYFKLK